MRLQQTLEKHLPTVSNMLFPAFVFAAILFTFLLDENIDNDWGLFFHWSFLFMAFLNFVIMLNFNYGKSLLLVLLNLISYITLNYLKNRFGTDFNTTFDFQALCVLYPFNVGLFYFWHERKFISRRSLSMLVVFLLQFGFVENIDNPNILSYSIWQNINLLALICYGSVFLLLLFKSIQYGRLFDYCVMYVLLSSACGFYYSAKPFAVSMFFFVSMLCLTVYLLYTLVYNHFYDNTTGFYSRNSYLIQSKHFPLKYSLGIISIDNYDKLALTFGRKKQKIITSLIADVIQEMTADEVVFRYAADQFIVLYKKFDKKEAIAHLDNIRRTIAGLSFSWSTSQKPLKLTVSCSVSEKKRSDSGAVEVLMRADKAMRQTLKFSHNVTSQG